MISHRHHYLPKFYIKNFGIKDPNKKYHIWVYNKKRKIYESNSRTIDSIGYIKDFHTLIINGKETDYFEKAHDKIYESVLSKKYEEIIFRYSNTKYVNHLHCVNVLVGKKKEEVLLKQLNEKEIISNEDKRVLSYILAYFIVRNRKWRDKMYEFYDKVEEISRDLYRANMPDASEDRIVNNIEEMIGRKSDIKISHIETMFDGKTISEIAEILKHHIWCLVVNDTEHDFYTSDVGHGLAVNDKNYPKIWGIGYGSYSLSIYFPITPKLCLHIFERQYIRDECKSELTLYENKASFLNVENVIYINHIVYQDAQEEIYSQSNEWFYVDKYSKDSNS